MIPSSKVWSRFTAWMLCAACHAVGVSAQSPGVEVLLIVHEEGGLSTRRFEDIRSVKASPKGRIVLVHGEGVAAIEPELVPESFLASWGLSVEMVREVQRTEEESRVRRLAVRRAVPRDSFSWLTLPPPSRGSGQVLVGNLPWNDVDQAELAKLGNGAELSLAVSEFPWWSGEEGTKTTQSLGLRGRAVVQADSRFDSVMTVEDLMSVANSQANDSDWLEALPRPDNFDVWRDVWADFPLVPIAQMVESPADYLDDMVRVRGLFGSPQRNNSGEYFTLREGGIELIVRYGSMLQAAAIQQGIEERLRALRALPGNFSREVTLVGEVSLDDSGQPVLDLIDFLM